MTTATTKKITLATLKAFVRKHRDKLLIRTESYFDGQIDGSREVDNPEYHPVRDSSRMTNPKYDLGIAGVHIVHGGGNIFTAFETETHVGFRVYNCCRTFRLAILK